MAELFATKKGHPSQSRSRLMSGSVAAGVAAGVETGEDGRGRVPRDGGKGRNSNSSARPTGGREVGHVRVRLRSRRLLEAQELLGGTVGLLPLGPSWTLFAPLRSHKTRLCVAHG